MKKIVLPAIAALSLAAGTLAFAQAQAQPAQTQEPAKQERQMRGERPNRGPVTAEQFGQRRLDNLKSADTNGDGKLSHEELEQFAMKQQAKRAADRMMRRLDIDGDGTVTLAELERHNQKRFAFFDRNDNGKLERHERRQMRQFHGQRHGGERGWHRGPGPHHGKPHEGPRHHRHGSDNQKMEL